MRILLGVTGGIAAYKALELVRLAVKAGHSVRVVQTPTSQTFVGAASFATLTGAPVLVSEFERDPARGAFPDQDPPAHDPASHLELVRNADVYLVAPASANTIAKLAHGLADNLLTSAALAATCPLIVAPAMNHHMWEHPATKANLDLLRERGVVVVDPGTGALATRGEWGHGRLAEPVDLLTAVEALPATDASAPVPTTGPWDALHVLVTAGGTREPIDAVRYVGNRSSGRMGWALAAEAAALGARVTVVAANVTLDRPAGGRIDYVDVQTAEELRVAAVALAAQADVVLMSAAVSDFRPAHAADTKLKKDGRDGLRLELVPTADVLTEIAAARRPGQVIVGFAAEHGAQAAVGHARGKLERKGLDAVVVNDISRDDIGFDSLDNEVTIVTADDEIDVGRRTKAEVARAVLTLTRRLHGTLNP